MKIDLEDKEMELLLETLGKAHFIKHMLGEDDSDLEGLVQKMAKFLKAEGKFDIFLSVFKEVKP